MAIPVGEMPALRTYSAGRTTRLVVCVGRAEANDIGRVGGRVIRSAGGRLKTRVKGEGNTVTNIEGANRV